jgi:transposase
VTTITNDSYIRAAEVCDLLWKIALEYKGKVVYIVFDNTSYQKCNEVQNFAAKLKINLIFIPLYSPNLNLIERF